MSTVRLNPTTTNNDLRASLFAGDLVVFTNIAAVHELVVHARCEINALFAPHDPEQIHTMLDPAELAARLLTWKPAFIRHPESVRLAKAIATQIGFDQMQTHFDLPRPRTAYPVGHLTSGIAYAFPWHRDTWYSAPKQQINVWLPVWEPAANNAMAFDPAGFGNAVPNNSADFNYYRRNVERSALATAIESDPRAQPGAIDWVAANETIVLPSPGSVLLFAGDQLHRTIPNTSGRSRYSIDFRLLNITDVEENRGGPAVDVACSGTSIRDFKRISDNAEMPDEIVRMIEPNGPGDDVVLEFRPA
jgi:hypothetical protein